MTEQEIRKYLHDNATDCRAYKVLPKEVQDWLWLNRSVSDHGIMAMTAGGCWVHLAKSNSCKPLPANMIFTVTSVE